MPHDLEIRSPSGRLDEFSVETEPLKPTWAESFDLRIPGLTILYHPNLTRIGEWTSLPGLGAGNEEPLSRQAPTFHPHHAATHQPLGDRHLSRSPIVLRGRPDGGVEIDCATSPMSLVADGELIIDRRSVDRDQLDRGIVLLVGERVVLLLHLLDPASSPDLPSFDLVGESPEMVRVRKGIRQVADLAVPVLVRGETGTGKELVASAIHRNSGRRDGEFVAVNMGAIAPNLAAAELFGATRGAFTGADREREGFFRRADGGTLLLDEIGEATSEVQVLLLRALETGEIQPVGEDEPQTVDVRVVSATDRNLEESLGLKQLGSFKQPLLHRLSGFVLQLPPLRDRLGDFGLLLVHFLRQELEAVGAAGRLEADDPWLSPSVVARLATYEWPGNVRQLQNVVRQLVISHRHAEQVPPTVALDGLLLQPKPSGGHPTEAEVVGIETPRSKSRPRNGSEPSRSTRRPSDIGEDELVSVLRAHRWQIQAAADAFGVPRSSLYDRVARTSRIRKASQLDEGEILSVRERCAGNVEAMADELEVSARALRRRMGQLGL